MEMSRETLDIFPTLMWRIVMPIDRPVNPPLLPMITLPVGKLQGVPKAAIYKDDTQRVDIGDDSFFDDFSKLNFGYFL
jgi:hypothetical protein